MVKLKASEWRELDGFMDMADGYPLDFSNKTFAEFFEDDFGVQIYDDQYSPRGNSKTNRLRSYIDQASAKGAGRVLRKPWSYKTSSRRSEEQRSSRLVGMGFEDVEALEVKFLPDHFEDEEFENFVTKVEERDEGETINAALVLAKTFDFDTVRLEIDRARAFVDEDPEDAITASCSLIEAVCKSVLTELQLDLPKDKSVKPLYRAVSEALALSPKRTDIDPLVAADVTTILSGITNTIGGIGSLRTHGGDAHGRDRGARRVDARIARLTVNTASAMAVFIIESWDRKFPSRTLRNSERWKES